LLDKAGYKDAGALLGGMHAWEAAGYEMDKAPPDPPKKN
jgi:3-mercaptopyruvate sulfurtransferase SseA